MIGEKDEKIEKIVHKRIIENLFFFDSKSVAAGRECHLVNSWKIPRKLKVFRWFFEEEKQDLALAFHQFFSIFTYFRGHQKSIENGIIDLLIIGDLEELITKKKITKQEIVNNSRKKESNHQLSEALLEAYHNYRVFCFENKIIRERPTVSSTIRVFKRDQFLTKDLVRIVKELIFTNFNLQMLLNLVNKTFTWDTTKTNSLINFYSNKGAVFFDDELPNPFLENIKDKCEKINNHQWKVEFFSKRFGNFPNLIKEKDFSKHKQLIQILFGISNLSSFQNFEKMIRSSENFAKLLLTEKTYGEILRRFEDLSLLSSIRKGKDFEGEIVGMKPLSLPFEVRKMIANFYNNEGKEIISQKINKLFDDVVKETEHENFYWENTWDKLKEKIDLFFDRGITNLKKLVYIGPFWDINTKLANRKEKNHPGDTVFSLMSFFLYIINFQYLERVLALVKDSFESGRKISWIGSLVPANGKEVFLSSEVYALDEFSFASFLIIDLFSKHFCKISALEENGKVSREIFEILLQNFNERGVYKIRNHQSFVRNFCLNDFYQTCSVREIEIDYEKLQERTFSNLEANFVDLLFVVNTFGNRVQISLNLERIFSFYRKPVLTGILEKRLFHEENERILLRSVNLFLQIVNLYEVREFKESLLMFKNFRFLIYQFFKEVNAYRSGERIINKLVDNTKEEVNSLINSIKMEKLYSLWKEEPNSQNIFEKVLNSVRDLLCNGLVSETYLKFEYIEEREMKELINEER